MLYLNGAKNKQTAYSVILKVENDTAAFSVISKFKKRECRLFRYFKQGRIFRIRVSKFNNKNATYSVIFKVKIIYTRPM